MLYSNFKCKPFCIFHPNPQYIIELSKRDNTNANKIACPKCIVIEKGENPNIVQDIKIDSDIVHLKNTGTTICKSRKVLYLLLSCAGKEKGKYNGSIQLLKSHFDLYNILAKGTGKYDLNTKNGKWSKALLSVPENLNTVVKINYSGKKTKTEYIIICNKHFYTYAEKEIYLMIPSYNAFEYLSNDQNWVTLL